ncbi:MAG: PDZ domain-containing protein [Planctomycetota bacterium]
MRSILTIPFVLLALVLLARPAYTQPEEPAPVPQKQQYESIQEGIVTIKYAEGWKEAAENFAKKLDGAIKNAGKTIGFKPETPIEFCIVHIKPGSSPPPGVLQRGYDQNNKKINWCTIVRTEPKDFKLDAQSVQNDLLSVANIACQVELFNVNPTLAQDPGVAWFGAGYGLFFTVETMKEMYGKDYKSPFMFSDGWLEAAKDTIFKAKPTQRGFRPEHQAALYQFFAELHEKYKEKRYAKIIDEVKKLEKINTESLIKAIDTATGGDCVKFCKEYKCENKYPFLGIMADMQRAEPGVQITEVVEGSSAADADLRAGDIIEEANGKPVKTLEDLQAIITEAGTGEQLKMIIDRNGSKIKALATLKTREFEIKEMPASPPGPEPKPPAPQPRTPEELLKSAGFAEDQIELMMKMFERRGPTDPAPSPEEIEKIVIELRKAGYTDQQISALLSLFKLK